MERSNGYIVGFAAAICLVCAIFVSSSAVGLRDRQIANKMLDRQSKVLSVAGLLKKGADAATIEKAFLDNISAEVIDLATGASASGADAATFDQRKRTKDPETSSAAPEAAKKAGIKRLPNRALVYKVLKGERLETLVLPITGKGLWSTLYGFIALERDGNTVKGLTFYEHLETPGLGGEVDNPIWKALWPGKKAFADGRWDQPVIEVVKGQAKAGDPHKVDGLSGATITSRGVSDLVKFWLGPEGFGPYLATLRAKGG